MSTPDCCSPFSSELQLPDQLFAASCRRRRTFRRLPSRRGGRDVKRLFVEILFEHVECVGAESIAASCRPAPRSTVSSSGVFAARPGRPRAPPARAPDPRRNADVEQMRRALPRRRDRERAESGRRAAQQILKTGIGVGERQRFVEIAVVRSAVHAEQADRGRDRRLRLARRGLLKLRQLPAPSSPIFRAPAPHRPAAGHRASRSRRRGTA